MAERNRHLRSQESKREPVPAVSTGDMEIKGASPKGPDKGKVKNTQVFQKLHLPTEIEAAESKGDPLGDVGSAKELPAGAVVLPITKGGKPALTVADIVPGVGAAIGKKKEG